MGLANEKKAALPSDLKRRNYTAILDAFRGGDILSANEIADRTGISRQTVMKAINHFVKKGLITSVGKGASTEIGGKRPELFQFCMQKYLLCIGHSGDQMVFCLYDLTCRLLGKVEAEISPNTPLEIVMASIERESRHLLEMVACKREELYGICMVIGGIIDHETGVFRYSSLAPSWGRDVPLKDMLEKKFPAAVVQVENVARMAACAAVLDHPEYEKQDVISLYTDTGISACYLEKGNIRYGRHSLIGEIGPVIVDYSQVVNTGREENGSFSYLIGEEHLNQKIKEYSKGYPTSTLWKYKENIPLNKIFLEAEYGDALARKIVHYVADIFGILMGNLMFAFDPETIIIQGRYAKAGEYFEKELRKTLQRYPFALEPEAYRIRFDQRPLLQLQLMGATKILTRKFFTSVEWLQ